MIYASGRKKQQDFLLDETTCDAFSLTETKANKTNKFTRSPSTQCIVAVFAVKSDWWDVAPI